ncbi:MAG: LCP family protein [Eubacteriaceae bacterium]
MKKKIILSLLILIVCLIGTGLVYGYNTLNQLQEIVDTPKLSTEKLKINYDLDIDTVNIALFGIDGRSDVDGDRADTIMIVSLDFRNKIVKVTSVMRDLLVQIPETDETYETKDKINAAYAYGGPELSVQTLNENFDLNIQDYVVVNFDAMVDTVDALGGIEIDVKNEDVLDWTNQYIDDVNEKVNRSDPKLETVGPQVVYGVQALAYARNRFSDDDYGRTERQREVVGEVAKKAFDIDIITGVSLLNKIYPYIKTTLSLKEIMTYAQAFMNSDDTVEKAFLDFRVPTDKYNTTDMINNVSYVIPNALSDNVIALHRFIYGPTEIAHKDGTVTKINMEYTPYVPSKRLFEISDSIAYYAGTSPKGNTNATSDDEIATNVPKQTESTYTDNQEETSYQNDTTTNDNTSDSLE